MLSRLMRFQETLQDFTRIFFTFKELTSKPVGFMQSCCALFVLIFSRWLPLVWFTRPSVVIVKLIVKTQANNCLSCPISCSTTPSDMHTCHLHAHMSSACHLHIICSTPHGHCGTKLSFYCDRNWLLNEICCNNVVSFQDHVNDLQHNLYWWFSLHVTYGHCSHVICICTCHPHIIWVYAYYVHIICSGPWYISS